MKDGRKLMGHLGERKRGAVFFRTHNLLNTGDGTAACRHCRTQIDSHRHRRERPGRLRRLPGPAKRLPQRHRVLELYGRQFFAHLTTGRAARRQSGRRPDLGFHFRRPGLVRRLPATGQQWHRSARHERVPPVRQNGRDPAEREQRCRPEAGRCDGTRRARPPARMWMCSPAKRPTARWPC